MITNYPPDGKRITVQPLDVARLWIEKTRLIPAQYAIGTCQHESDFVSNCDTLESNGQKSKGLFQINSTEAVESGYGITDPFDMLNNLTIFAVISEKRLDKILASVRYPSNVPTDTWAYLFIAHNQGISASLKSIATYGMDWEKYKSRNPNPSWHAYGDDVISGGKYWSDIQKVIQ